MIFRFTSLVLIFLFMAHHIAAQDLNTFLNKTDTFLKEVVIDKSANYSLAKEKQPQLAELTKLISQIAPQELPPLERKSFLINTYNLLVINELVQNYPISSTQKIDGFFKKTKHNVGGHAWTLDQIENQQLLPEYKDPRMHFVLNCGAIGCPPISNFAYRPDLLEQQLENQTKLAINDEDFIYELNGKNYLSKIFSWYENDFKKDGGRIEFINQYRTKKLNPKNKNVFYPYDWSINDIPKISSGDESISFIQTFTPSKLLRKGQLEVQLFNNLYTQTAFRNADREKVDLNQRENYFTGLINILYGANKDRRWNVGMDINFRSVRIDSVAGSSPTQVLRFRENDLRNRTAISSLGPVLKYVPFKNVSLSIKSSFLIPIAEDGESDERDPFGNSVRPWFDWNRFTFWNQFFYDKNIGEKWQVFFEADLLFRFAKKAKRYANNQPKQDLLDTPISTFLSYFPTQKSTVYIMLQYSPQFAFNEIESNEKVNGFKYQGDFAQTGIGFKYQVLDKLGLEVSYTNFFTSSSQGAGSTFNLGIRYIR